jgi:hypothetical protein
MAIMIDNEAMIRNQKQIDNAIRKYKELIKKIEDMSPIFQNFKTEYSEIVNQNFGAKGKIMERERWIPYTPAYLKFKQKKYPGKPMLEITGDLMKAAINFDAKITKKNMIMEVKGKDYFYYVSDRETYGRKFFYTKDKTMPIQAWRILIELIKKRLEVDNAKNMGA